MATTIEIHELPTRLAEILALVSSGNEVVLLAGSIPRARIVPCDNAQPRKPGLHPGAMQPTPDFDAPLPYEFWNGQL